MPKCETCMFHSDTNACHRYPPQVVYERVMSDVYRDIEYPQTRNYHPYTVNDDWCGEHKEKT